MPVDWSAAPSQNGLMLKWADGWIEVFPEGEFSDECKDIPRKILMYRKKSRPCVGEYTLTVRGTTAELDYGGQFKKANRAPSRDFYIGTTRILFSDESRVEVLSVGWRDEDASAFEEYDIACSWLKSGKPVTSAFQPPQGDERKRKPLSSVLRPGQLRFRRSLLDHYGRTCCITGCSVEHALEAAHIMPFRGLVYDHVQNGLVLRSDLHRLFDKHLIAIHPRTLQVHVSPQLSGYPEYQMLAGRTIALPRESEARPAAIALEHQWDAYKGGANR